jgi:hypothetical protein
MPSDSNTNYFVSRGVRAHSLAKRPAADASAETSRFCQDLVERA